MRPILKRLAALLLCGPVLALAADPPRVEQLSNPQSQTVGRKYCPGTPPVWVPLFDPCPGERSPAAGSGGGGAAPAVRPMPAPPPRVTDPANAQRDRQRAVELQRQAESYLSSRGPEINPRRAFDLYFEVCNLAPDLEGCGWAAGMLIDDPVTYRGEVPNPDPEALLRLIIGLGERGCRGGDLQACFALAYTQRQAGRRITAPVFRGIEAEEFEAYAVRRRENRQAAVRPVPPAPAMPGAAPTPSPPVAAMAPPAQPSPRAPAMTVAQLLAEHRKYKTPGSYWMLEAIRLEPENAELHHLLGETYTVMGMDLDKAVAAAERAVALEPGNALYWRGLGLAWQRRLRWDEAAKAIQKSVDLSPDDPAGWKLLFQMHENYQYGGRDLPGVLERAVARYPEKVFLWQRQGEEAERRGDRTVALAAYQKLVALGEGDLSLQAKVGSWLCEAGRRKEAISAFETILNRQPDLTRVLDDYNLCRMRLGLPRLKAYPPRAAAARP